MTREALSSMTDDQLMELVREKNLRQAYDVLVFRHYREAVRFCMKMLGDEQAVLDIVQDSFADIYVHRSQVSLSCAFRTYLLAVVKHKALDEIRKNTRHRTEELVVSRIEVPGQSEQSPEELYVRKRIHRNSAMDRRTAEGLQTGAYIVLCGGNVLSGNSGSYGEKSCPGQNNTVQGKEKIAEAEEGTGMMQPENELLEAVWEKAERKEENLKLAGELSRMPFASLMIFSLLLVLGIVRGKKIAWGSAVSSVWIIGNLLLMGLAASWYRTLLEQVPVVLLEAAGVAAVSYTHLTLPTIA